MRAGFILIACLLAACGAPSATTGDKAAANRATESGPPPAPDGNDAAPEGNGFAVEEEHDGLAFS